MASIALYDDGAELSIKPACGYLKRKPPPPPEKHGQVQFSRQSRKRMRQALLTMQSNEPGFRPFAVTLTIPGPVLDLEDSKRLFNRFSWMVNHNGWSAIWRAEVQQRGALHWHLKMWGMWESLPCAWMEVRAVFFQALDLLGPVEGKTAKGREVRRYSRSDWPGADSKAVDVQCKQTRSAWLRYMADHATKTKAGQVGQNIGRHWGIIGRARLASVEPQETVSLTSRQYMRVSRSLERLARPSVPCACVFGSKLGFKRRIGRSGSTVTFTKPETIRRLIAWATSNGSRKV